MEPALDMHDDEIDDLLRLRDLLREARNSMWQLWNRQPLPIFGLILTILLFNLVGCGGGKPEKKQLTPSAQLAQAKKIVAPDERSQALTEVSLRYLKAADNGGARSTLLLATQSADEIKKRDASKRAATYILLAKAWYQVQGNNKDECKDAYRDAEKSIERIKNPVEKTEALLNLAELKNEIDKKSSAKKHLDAGTEGVENIEDPVERVRLLGKLARFYVKIGKNQDAASTISAALNLAEDEQDAGKKATLLIQIAGEQMGSLDDRAQGMETLSTAQKLADTLGENPNRQANLMIDVSQVYLASGQKSKAREILDAAEKICRGRSECKPAMKRIEKIRDKM